MKPSALVLLSWAFLSVTNTSANIYWADVYMLRSRPQTSAEIQPVDEYSFHLSSHFGVGNPIEHITPVGIPGPSRAATLADVQAVYPAGSYSARISYQPPWDQSVPRQTFELHDEFPAEPAFNTPIPQVLNGTWENGGLTIPRNFTLELDPWTTRPAHSLITVEISGIGGASRYFDQPITSIHFPQEQFPAGSQLQIRLSYVNFDSVQSVIVSPPGSERVDEFRYLVGSGESTRFLLTVIPEPQTYASMAGLSLLVFAACRSFQKRDPRKRTPNSRRV